MDFNQRCKIKKQLNNRLKNDGYWDAYNALRASLKQSGVPEGDAWRVAAYPFPPRNGDTAEIVADPLYAEIAAGWASRKYKMLDDLAESGTQAEAPTEAIIGHDKRRSEFQKLAAKVGNRTASELDESRWVVANNLVDVKQINPDDVPSTAALSILLWTQMSPSNFGEFLRTNYAKLLPDKKALEYDNRFKDTGQELNLLIEFEESLRREQEAAEAASGVTNAN